MAYERWLAAGWYRQRERVQLKSCPTCCRCHAFAVAAVPASEVKGGYARLRMSPLQSMCATHVAQWHARHVSKREHRDSEVIKEKTNLPQSRSFT